MASAAQEWEHPRWGRFAWDGWSWAGTVEAPAFDAFTYDRRGYGVGGGPPTGRYTLAFEADDENDTPSLEAAALAETVLAGQADLVSLVTEALWEDFNGRGPDSGMWWHDGLDEVMEEWEDADPPGGPADLLPLMRLSRITVRKPGGTDTPPVAELSFNAAFEEEHGVGVLTDGRTILGTGYSIDVTPFKSE